MPIFGNSNREVSSVKYFEIRLDESNIVLRGGEDESCSAILKGTLVLCLSEPLRIQGIRLRFTGEKRLGWFTSSGSGPNYVKHEDEFTRHTWEFKRSTEALPAGNYEWPFDMILPGSTPESVEGLQDTWVIYRMKATIERSMLQTNSVARKQVRIIRTLDPAALELAHAMSVDNVWPDKIQYSISTPSKAVIFGSNIYVDFTLIPLLKGLKIGKIVTELNERQDLTIRSQRAILRSRTSTRQITKDEFTLPDHAEMEDIEGQEGFLFSRTVPVPQSLKQCVQTAEVLGVKIRHSLGFNIQLHNPDGHVSELHATLPVHIFLSPNLPIDDNNNLVNHGTRTAIAATGLNDLTPPQYGAHQFDQLYSDIDPSGYMTPANGASGVNTPFQSHSRSVSSENLASMDAMTSDGFAANVLQFRLNNLDGAGANRVARDRSRPPNLEDAPGGNTPRADGTTSSQTGSLPHGGYFPQHGGSAGQQASANNLSRSVSEEDGQPSGPATPQHIEYSAESLAKVPSYKTALQTNPRTPMQDGLPSYQTATRPLLPSPPREAHLHQASRGIA